METLSEGQKQNNLYTKNGDFSKSLYSNNRSYRARKKRKN